MPTTRPTLAPEPAPGTRALAVRVAPTAHYSLFFDDHAAAMYRNFDTTPRFVASNQQPIGIIAEAGLGPGLLSTGAALGHVWVVSAFIFSRMTHRPVFAPAGALPERMTP
jgi:hypothetical protein